MHERIEIAAVAMMDLLEVSSLGKRPLKAGDDTHFNYKAIHSPQYKREMRGKNVGTPLVYLKQLEMAGTI